MNDKNVLGETIRYYREKRGLSQLMLGELSGVRGQTINRIESGQRKQPRSATLKQIADALGVSTDALLAGIPPQGLPEIDLEDEMIAEFRTAQNKEELLALVRAYKLVRARPASAGN